MDGEFDKAGNNTEDLTEKSSEISTVENNGVPQSNENETNEMIDTSSEDMLSSSDDGDAQNTDTGETNKKKDKSFWIRMSIFSVCLCVFVYSVVMVCIKVMEGNSSKDINDKLKEEFFELADRTDLMPYLSPVGLNNVTLQYGKKRDNGSQYSEYTVIQSTDPAYTQIREKLIEYKQANPEIYGWIKVDGTGIDYAVVKGGNNDYYLNHTVTKAYNENGSIFADFRCEDSIINNRNTVLYGHNSVYRNQMFNQITKFLDKSFFTENKYITVYTIDGIYRYEIFAVYETYSTYSYSKIYFETDEEFIDWCTEMKGNSVFERKTRRFTGQSKIITLSTCTNGYYSRRYSLQGRLVSIEK